MNRIIKKIEGIDISYEFEETEENYIIKCRTSRASDKLAFIHKKEISICYDEVVTIPKETIDSDALKNYSLEPYISNLKLRLDFRLNDIQRFISEQLNKKQRS